MVQKLSKLIKICKKDVAKVLLLCFMDHSDYGFGLILYDVFDMSVTFIVHCYLLTYLLTYSVKRALHYSSVLSPVYRPPYLF